MRRAWILVLGAVALSAAVFLAAGSYLVRPTRATLGSPPAGAMQVSFPSESGALLHGWFFPVEKPRGSVVLMHGLRGNRANMTNRARLVTRLGFSALSFDFQAHGESEGEQITFGGRESCDARAAVGYLRQRVPDLPVFVVGVSLGGAAALLSTPPLEVNGMVLEAVYPDIDTAVSNRLSMRIPYGSLGTPLFTAQLGPRLGISAEQLDPARAAAGVRTPMLVLAGSEDLHTTASDTHRLFDSISAWKRLVWFDGAGHVDFMVYNPGLYTAEVESFLTREQPTAHDPPGLGPGAAHSPRRASTVEQGAPADSPTATRFRCG